MCVSAALTDSTPALRLNAGVEGGLVPSSLLGGQDSLELSEVQKPQKSHDPVFECGASVGATTARG